MFTRVFGKTSFWSYSIALILLLQAIYWHHNLIAETYPNTNLTIKSVIVAFLAIINLVLVEVILRGVLFFHKGNYHLLVFIMFFWILPITEWSIWLWFATLFFWFSVFQIFKLEINELLNCCVFLRCQTNTLMCFMCCLKYIYNVFVYCLLHVWKYEIPNVVPTSVLHPPLPFPRLGEAGEGWRVEARATAWRGPHAALEGRMGRKGAGWRRWGPRTQPPKHPPEDI